MSTQKHFAEGQEGNTRPVKQEKTIEPNSVRLQQETVETFRLNCAKEAVLIGDIPHHKDSYVTQSGVTAKLT